MEPSSLVLVAIIGVWAAYLVPHWVRRREELAQSRTPDRFSDGLRVLQRRRRRGRSGHRSGGAVLTSPRLVVDVDGELLYIPGRRGAGRAETAKAAAPVDSAVKPDEVTSSARRARDLSVALASARAAARRRAVILLGLLVITVAAGVAVPVLKAPLWVAAPSAVLLLLHLMASRVAAIRSAEHLAVVREQARPVPVSRRRPATVGPAVAVARPAAEEAPAVAPDRVARRAIAVGAQTWEPIPVPVPTYTLKPAVFRPEPPPLDLPAASASPGPRGALPRRAEEIERILALDADPVLALQQRTAVNG